VIPVQSLTVLGAAMGWDLCLGEPPVKCHPVVWLGAVISWLERSAPRVGRARQLVWGSAVALLLPALFGVLAWWVLHALQAWPWAYVLVATFLLTSSLSLRMLGASGREVATALQERERPEDLRRARERVSWICSRDTSELDEGQLVATTVESLAENASDSVVAPLFWFALLGVPGAVAYRVANTLDARLGYRGRYEYLGKAVARLDDVLNLIPARVTAVMFFFAAALRGMSARNGLRIWWRDSRNTPSPNGGAPMATMAGLLRVRLSKPGVYDLGDAERPLDAACIEESWRVVRLACLLAFALAMLAVGVRDVL
jgi:adenosylcobinamide-phosphate synthase